MMDDRSAALDQVRERELNALIERRAQAAHREEADRREEDRWVASARHRDRMAERANLEARLAHARAMLRSHSLSFARFTEKWESEISKLEALLGEG